MFQLAVGYLFSTKAALTGNWAQNDPNIFTISDVFLFYLLPINSKNKVSNPKFAKKKS